MTNRPLIYTPLRDAVPIALCLHRRTRFSLTNCLEGALETIKGNSRLHIAEGDYPAETMLPLPIFSHSHSIVPGGLLVMSYVTRLMPRTSFTMRVAVRVRNAMSKGYTSAVMPSTLVTARSAQALS